MFFTKCSALPALLILSVATPLVVSQCITGSLECCESVQPASSPDAASLLDPQGIIEGADVPIDISCYPFLAGECIGDLVCCDSTSLTGDFAINCVSANSTDL